MKDTTLIDGEDRLVAALLKRMANGDVGALDTLYTLYHGALLRLYSAILQDSFEAEEVLQDTFVKVFREAGRYDSRMGAPFPWMVTIGKRLAIDRLRRRKSRPGIPHDNMEQAATSADQDSGYGADAIHQQLELGWIRESLERLSSAQQRAIELAFFKGYTHHEISEITGKPLGTIKSDIHRGLAHLRAVYLEGSNGQTH